MNRALLIPEILRLIIRQLHPFAGKWPDSDILIEHMCFDTETSSPEHLRRAALVCTLFSEHALDYLWWLMTDLTPLFRLLPAFKPASEVLEESLLDGNILPEDLCRFNLYARRIRAYHGSGIEMFHPSTVFRVLKECDRSHLLPKLPSLVLPGTGGAPEISFVCPHLKGFKLRLPIRNKDRDYLGMYACISDLPITADNLLSLNLTTNLSTDSITCIFQLRRLQYLELTHLPGNGRPRAEIELLALLKIFSAPVLRDLRLVERIIFKALPSPWTFLEATTFPSLERLEITAGDRTMHTLNAFLRSTWLPRLRAFIGHLEWARGFHTAERTQWSNLLRVLSDVTTDEFSSIKVSQNGDEELPEGQQRLPPIRDLLDDFLLQLTSFEIVAPLFSSISILDLRYIARRWPNMTELSLARDSNPVLGLDALSLIAQNLPHLETLHMILPCEIVAAEQIPILDHPLDSLFLYSLRSPSPQGLMCSVDKMFPHLRSWSFQTDDGEMQDLYDEASSLLNIFKSIRDDQLQRQIAYLDTQIYL